MTTDSDRYTKNPQITYYVYYTLIYKSLEWEFILPINNLKTTIGICSNDLRNGCNEQALIPFTFCKLADGTDPLFNVGSKFIDLTLEEVEKQIEKEEQKIAEVIADATSDATKGSDATTKETMTALKQPPKQFKLKTKGVFR